MRQLNGHGGRRSKSGRKLLLSPEEQIYAAAMCEYLQLRSTKRATALRLSAYFKKKFPGLNEQYREIQSVRPRSRHLIFGEDDHGFQDVELAQEARLTNAVMLADNRLHSIPIARGLDRPRIMKVVARIMSRRSGKIIKPEYIRKIWNRWGRSIRSDL